MVLLVVFQVGNCMTEVQRLKARIKNLKYLISRFYNATISCHAFLKCVVVKVESVVCILIFGCIFKIDTSINFMCHDFKIGSCSLIFYASHFKYKILPTTMTILVLMSWF